MVSDSSENESRPGGGETTTTPTRTDNRLGRLGVFARFLAVCTALLIFVGAMVTTSGSGLSVPDWPLSFGTWDPRMVGGVAFEHGHRLVATFVGLLTIIMAVWASVVRSSRTLRRVAWVALALVIVQGLLGGLTVLMRLPVPVAVAHACTAQFFFCVVIALVLLTTPSYVHAKRTLTGAGATGLRISSLAALGIIVLQLILGATMRHMGAGLAIPDFPTSLGRWIPPMASPGIAVNYAHRVTALMVVLIVGLLVARILRKHSDLPALKRLAFLIAGLVLVQVMLGALTVWTARGLIPTSLHVTNGALVLATAFAIVMWSFRVSQPEGRRQAGPVDEARQPEQATGKDWMELSKARLVTLSAFTAVAGYWMTSTSPSLWMAAAVALGIMLVGGGAGILNHVFEMETDACMLRTCNRPLPAGRVDPIAAERVGAVLSLGGTLFLGLLQPLAGLLAALAAASYVFFYTPLKRKTQLCTVVGAVPGALPVLVGSVAAAGRVTLGGVILFLILFLWQIPHFVAIAWLCREDYARAGFPMVTVVDPEGRRAAFQALAYGLALLPVSLAPSLCGMAGLSYFCLALVLGLGYLAFGARMSLKRTPARARQLLLASVVYLPLLYGIMMVSR